MKYTFILLFLFLCSCATTYQSKGLSGGYSEAQIDVNTYRVTFAGNGYSTRDQVENMLLYRSAELTKEKGYDWFLVTEREGDVKTSEQYGQTDISSTAIIKMFKGAKPDTMPKSYDAESVLTYLGKNIKR